jgi:hypothetical protein
MRIGVGVGDQKTMMKQHHGVAVGVTVLTASTWG